MYHTHTPVWSQVSFFDQWTHSLKIVTYSFLPNFFGWFFNEHTCTRSHTHCVSLIRMNIILLVLNNMCRKNTQFIEHYAQVQTILFFSNVDEVESFKNRDLLCLKIPCPTENGKPKIPSQTIAS